MVEKHGIVASAGSFEVKKYEIDAKISSQTGTPPQENLQVPIHPSD